MSEAEQRMYYSDGIAPAGRSSSDELFLVTIEARPEPNSNEYGEAGGAFVNCWVDADDLRTAERRAVALIQQNGWRPHRFDDWKLVTRATYEGDGSSSDGPGVSEVVEQALIDGEVCLFHTWPAHAPDAEDE